MRNVIQKQEDLKGLSQQQLVKEMQMPSGQFEQFLVLTELGRRKRMTDDQARREAADDTNTVAQEVVNAAGVPQGGIAQLASAMNAKTDNTQNTGVKQMAEGGVVKMQEAGQPTDALQRLNEEAVAELKRLYPEVYEQYKDKPRELLYIARQMVKVAKDPELTGLEALERPGSDIKSFFGLNRTPGEKRAIRNMRKIERGSEEREIADQIATQKALTRYFDGGDTRIPTIFDNPIFAEGAPTEYLKGTSGGGFPRTLSQVGSPMISTPSMGLNNLSSSTVNGPNTAPEVTLGSLPPPEINLATPPNMPPFTSMIPSLSTGDVKLGGNARDAAIKKYLAEGPRDSYRPEVGPYSKQLEPFGPNNVFYGGRGMVNASSPVDVLDAFNEGKIYERDPRTQEIRDDILRGINDRYYNSTPTSRDPADQAVYDVNRRAIDFVNSDTSTPREEVYSDYLGGDARAIARYQEESPEEVQAISDRLAREAAAGEEAKVQASLTDLTENNKEGLGPDAAAALREGALRTLQDRTQPTLVEGVNIPKKDQSLFVDAGELALKGLGKSYELGTDVADYIKDLPIAEAVTQVGGDIKDIVSEGIQVEKDLGLNPTSLYKRLTDDTIYPVDGTKFGQPQDREPLPDVSVQANEAAEAKTKTKTKTDPIQDAVNKIIENQNKQAGASNLSMSKYLEGLEKDREFDKAMALVEAGGQLMQPSATIGEGVGKSLKAFTKSRRAGQKEYNKSKLAIIGLGAKIDAAKASASARAGIAGAQLQTATLAGERDQLQAELDMAMLPFRGSSDPPDAKSSIVIKDLQRKIADLNNQIRTASGLATLASVGAGGGNIFGSYDVTKAG